MKLTLEHSSCVLLPPLSITHANYRHLAAVNSIKNCTIEIVNLKGHNKVNLKIRLLNKWLKRSGFMLGQLFGAFSGYKRHDTLGGDVNGFSKHA